MSTQHQLYKRIVRAIPTLDAIKHSRHMNYVVSWISIRIFFKEMVMARESPSAITKSIYNPVVLPSVWLDGEVMNREITNRTALSTDQHQTLVKIIIDQSGHNLSFNDFTDQVLLLLEDISGFEVISDSESQSIINQLWSYYHGPDK